MSKIIRNIILVAIIFFSGFISACQTERIKNDNDDPFNNLDPDYVEIKRNPDIILTCLTKKNCHG